ncbi:hypothetical protein QTP86_023663 [Hemibagrus guttatus]|nr:hypothetical protein QTP86_023663 [Hemibagrus guttatus]
MPHFWRKNTMSFCSYDKVGHRFWILELVQVQNSSKQKNLVICHIVGVVMRVLGKRILLDPLLDKRVETTTLSGRWQLWFLLSDLPNNFFFCFVFNVTLIAVVFSW